MKSHTDEELRDEYIRYREQQVKDHKTEKCLADSRHKKGQREKRKK